MNPGLLKGKWGYCSAEYVRSVGRGLVSRVQRGVGVEKIQGNGMEHGSMQWEVTVINKLPAPSGTSWLLLISCPHCPVMFYWDHSKTVV